MEIPLEDIDIRVVKNGIGFNVFSMLPERRKTEAVSLAAVRQSANNLEYVPESVLTPEICRTALNTKDADVDILSQIPFPEVQREGVQKFTSSGIPPFVVYGFVDIRDTQTANEAVKADAYCLQFVPDKLLSEKLCKMALQNPNADKKVLGFIPEKFRTPAIYDVAEKQFSNKQVERKKEQSPLPKKKGLRV